jgi:hypothetical protein
VKRLKLVQLPVPPPAALASTGNVPLAAGCLGVAARVHGLDKRLEIQVVAPEVTDRFGDTQLADFIARDEPDFLGLSLYLWSSERSLHLAREVKRRSPRTQVLIGGPEVGPDNPFILAQQGFDVAVTGEAEDTFSATMDRLVEGGDAAGMPGVSVRKADGLTPFGPAANANFPLTRYPSPYTEGLVAVEPDRSTYIETVRGCRSHCTFCFYPRSSSVLRVLDVERSAQLVASLRAKGAREVVFLDPTFNHRPDFEALLDALARVNPDRSVSFFGEVRAEGLTAEHAKQLAKAGFTKLEIGLQSVNTRTLKNVKRGGSPQKVAAAAKLLHDVGIELLVDLIVGLPGDTSDDVLRGIDFLNEHGLADEAQVFGLSLLPGTAMRTTAAADGVEFDPSPPYRVLRTSTMDNATLRQTLSSAEERLDRRLDELPRPHLVDSNGPDVFRVDLERPQPTLPGAQHVAVWFDGLDLFARREAIARAIDARLAIDPYATIDVVLVGRREFPLDLIDFVRARLAAGTQSYLSRTLALRGEDLLRRIAVVLPAGAQAGPEWIDAVRELVPVFRDQSLAQAAADAEELGDTLPAARVVGTGDEADWRKLAQVAEPSAVAFADRELEVRWLRAQLGFGDAARVSA